MRCPQKRREKRKWIVLARTFYENRLQSHISLSCSRLKKHCDKYFIELACLVRNGYWSRSFLHVHGPRLWFGLLTSRLLPFFLDMLLIRLKLCKHNVNTQLCFLSVWYSDHISHNLNKQRNCLWKRAHSSKRQSGSNSSRLKELKVIVLLQLSNNLNSCNMHSCHHDRLMQFPTPISLSNHERGRE